MSNSEHVQTPEEVLETIDISHALKMGEALNRLRENEDFKTVILDGYLNENVMASWSLLGVPQMKGNRGNIMEDLVACANLKYFFAMVDNQYMGATNPILSDEEEEELARQEAAGGVN